MPDSQLGRLQIIQNSAARLITGTKKYSSITPVLQELHWLPVKSRISFKILLLTFQCLHNMAPSYLQELLKKYTPARNLRSSQKNLLECPSLSTRFYGNVSFLLGGLSSGTLFHFIWKRLTLLIILSHSWKPFSFKIITIEYNVRCNPLHFSLS